VDDVEQQVLRAYFNIVARNHDDHVKNIAFLMDQDGQWRLSPAFDITYAYNPDGAWTSQHQMSLQGKRDRFERADLFAFAAMAGLKKPRARTLLDQIVEAVTRWPEHAQAANMAPDDMIRIQRFLRLELAS
jgi:serine/threonine-protein kinase HipA